MSPALLYETCDEFWAMFMLFECLTHLPWALIKHGAKIMTLAKISSRCWIMKDGVRLKNGSSMKLHDISGLWPRNTDNRNLIIWQLAIVVYTLECILVYLIKHCVSISSIIVRAKCVKLSVTTLSWSPDMAIIPGPGPEPRHCSCKLFFWAPPASRTDER